MDSSNLPIDQTLLERINPVFNTAKMTLFQLAYTDDKDAIAIAGKLGLTLENTQGDMSPPELLNNATILETRFRTMGVLAEQSGFTEVDLPCGYTPRAIEFARKGKRFIGLDLPAAIAEAKPVITSLIDPEKRELVSFEGVDATNYESMKAVLDNIAGPLCITTEGLLMYFTDSETSQLCDNIRRILAQHGGCWITSDPETTIQFVLSSQAIYGENFMELMLKAKTRVQDLSDVPVKSRTLVVNPKDAQENIRNAMVFLAKHGLKAERMVVGEYVPDLKSLEKLSAAQIKMLREAMMKFAYWKITPLAPGKALDTADVARDNFDLNADLVDGKLTLSLRGRLDTLSAPNLLAFFERTEKANDIHEVIADCRKLDYISSAGLRVLLIMQKKCKKGVTICYMNDTVKEILEQTGFDSVLNVEN